MCVPFVSPQQQGFQLEVLIHQALQQLGLQPISSDRNICSHYGNNLLNGIDHVVELGHKVIVIQDKWLSSSVGLGAVNHYIMSTNELSKLIHKRPIRLFVSKLPLSSVSKKRADKYGIVSIHNQDMEVLVGMVTDRVNTIMTLHGYRVNVSGTLQPRDYQLQALDSFRSNMSSGILCHPTGSGKSVTTLMLCGEYLKHNQRSILWITERKEVLTSIFDTSIIGTLQASQLLPDHLTVTRWDKKQYDIATLIICNTDRLLAVSSVQRYKTIQPGLVVFDECHHASADKTFDMLRYYKEQGAILIGVSATPIRTDGKNRHIDQLFDNHFISRISYLEGVDMGIVLPVSFMWIETVLSGKAKSPTHLRMSEDDIRTMLDSLDQIVAKSVTGKILMRTRSVSSLDTWYQLLEQAKDAYLNLSRYRLFFSHYKNSQDMTKFRHYPGKSALIVVDQCKEGYDQPNIDMCINLDYVNDKDPLTLMQEIGRATRKHGAKTECFYVDTFTFETADDKIRKIFEALIGYEVLLGSDPFDQLKDNLTIEDGKLVVSGSTGQPSFTILDMIVRTLGLDEVLTMAKDIIYPKGISYGQAKAIIRRKGITSIQAYRSLGDPRLPEDPKAQYPDDWKGWLDFLGLDKDKMLSQQSVIELIKEHKEQVKGSYYPNRDLNAVIILLRSLREEIPEPDIWTEVYTIDIPSIVRTRRRH